jgi:hypothetical protein
MILLTGRKVKCEISHSRGGEYVQAAPNVLLSLVKMVTLLWIMVAADTDGG